MKKYKYIIFDMDGTLFDTENISLMAWMSVKDKFNYPVCREMCIQLIGRTKQSAQEVYDKYMPKDFDIDGVYKHHGEFMRNFKKEHGPLPKTDLTKLFTTLKEKGYKLALCTSSKREVIDMNLDYGNWKPYFEVLVDGTMTSKGKPNPDIYLKTAQLLEADVKDCLVIEDSHSGILAAHRAGMDVAMVIDLVEPNEEIEKICCKIYHKLDDILEIL